MAAPANRRLVGQLAWCRLANRRLESHECAHFLDGYKVMNRTIATLIAAALFPVAASASDTEGHIPCGVSTLFMMARLQGLPVTLEEVELSLGPGSAGGHTLAELILAGGSFGLKLQAVKFDPDGFQPNAPLIAHLTRNDMGHYVILQPVGHSGHLIQVLDPPDLVEVLDSDDFARTSGWRGVALAPAKNHAASSLLLTFLIASAIVVMLFYLILRFIRSLGKK